MSTVLTPPAAHTAHSRSRVRFVDVVRSEWIKLRTVPSTMWSLLATLVVGIGISALIAALAAHAYPTADAATRRQWDPTAVSTAGGALAQLAIAVLGTMAITNEYATRAIRVSVAAVPHRGRLLAAKAVVVATIALVAGELVAFVAFGIGQAVMAGQAPTAGLSQPGVARAVAGVGLYMVTIALLGLALGTLLRSTAGAISGLVAIIYVLPGVAAALPASWRNPVEKYWPTQAGGQITSVVRSPHTLGPWTGLTVMCLAVAAALAAALFRLTRTDV